MKEPDRKRLIPLEVGRIPGGRLYRCRRSARRQARDYDRFWELCETRSAVTTRYEVVDASRDTAS